jgi:hypothetical protein
MSLWSNYVYQIHSRCSNKVVEAIYLQVYESTQLFSLICGGPYLALSRPREMPFLAELSSPPYVWHGENEAVRAHSSKNGWAEEWSN